MPGEPRQGTARASPAPRPASPSPPPPTARAGLPAAPAAPASGHRSAPRRPSVPAAGRGRRGCRRSPPAARRPAMPWTPRPSTMPGTSTTASAGRFGINPSLRTLTASSKSGRSVTIACMIETTRSPSRASSNSAPIELGTPLCLIGDAIPPLVTGGEDAVRHVQSRLQPVAETVRRSAARKKGKNSATWRSPGDG